MNKSADMKLEVLAHNLHAHCTKNGIPYIMAATSDLDGRTLRTANGTVTDVIELMSVLLVQMSEDTGNDLNELLAYLNLSAHHAQDVYRRNNNSQKE